MTYLRLLRNASRVAPIVLIFTASAMAEWKAANSDAAAAAKEPKIASVLEAVNVIDEALIKDNHAAFAALLAKDLVVNNPQNSVSIRGATGQRNTSGLISYSSYVRSIEYAGVLGEMVLLMGDERVVPKGDSPLSGKEVRRRFPDVWKMEGGHWVLIARQATIVAP